MVYKNILGDAKFPRCAPLRRFKRVQKTMAVAPFSNLSNERSENGPQIRRRLLGFLECQLFQQSKVFLHNFYFEL